MAFNGGASIWLLGEAKSIGPALVFGVKSQMHKAIPVRADVGAGTFAQVRGENGLLTEETARHAGHADILREQTDGAAGIDGDSAVRIWLDRIVVNAAPADPSRR
jgi:hypothetical protein